MTDSNADILHEMQERKIDPNLNTAPKNEPVTRDVRDAEQRAQMLLDAQKGQARVDETIALLQYIDEIEQDTDAEDDED